MRITNQRNCTLIQEKHCKHILGINNDHHLHHQKCKSKPNNNMDFILKQLKLRRYKIKRQLEKLAQLQFKIVHAC